MRKQGLLECPSDTRTHACQLLQQRLMSTWYDPNPPPPPPPPPGPPAPLPLLSHPQTLGDTLDPALHDPCTAQHSTAQHSTAQHSTAQNAQSRSQHKTELTNMVAQPMKALHPKARSSCCKMLQPCIVARCCYVMCCGFEVFLCRALQNQSKEHYSRANNTTVCSMP